MIVNFILGSIISIFTFLFSLLPAIIPQVPTPIQDIADFIITFSQGAFAVIMHIYTPVLAGVIVALVISLLVFNQAYFVLHWILVKLKIIGQ